MLAPGARVPPSPAGATAQRWSPQRPREWIASVAGFARIMAEGGPEGPTP